MKRNYFVFVQALLVTVVIFIIGFYIGLSVEGSHLNQVNDYYTRSEVSLVDILALNSLTGSETISCKGMVEATKNLLDENLKEYFVFFQKLTDSLKTLHTKYDVLRTYLWINSINIKKVCPSSNFSTIVYLYKHDEQDLTKKAEQNVWSKLLLEIKNENKNMFLIPIAQDSNLISLASLTERYNLTNFPAVIINENRIFYEIPEKGEILALINNSSI